ncbi:phage antirepressor KilAC domain-containing protein [Paenibacillus sp. FSL R10-2734]|uniref:phage antirepressor KilAC domain-containing protein n=1 Tax=Paenibacillus sp. FSL R10-2734 TaxID=2954691 RepID=UPI0030D78EFE
MDNRRLQIFNHSDFGAIRTVDILGKPHFVGNDVASALEYSRPYEAISTHCKGTVSYRVPTNGGDQETRVIPEGDIYRLIVKAADQSRSPVIKAKAEMFEHWIFDEVLPSIRNTGMYAADELLDNPDLLIQAATKLKEERAARRALEVKVEEDRPKVVFAEALEDSKDSVLIADLAKILKQNGINIGEIRLFKELRERGYLIKSGSEYNMPTQRSMELQIMEIKIGQRGSASEGMKVTRTPKITGKGIGYFINKFKGALS